MHIKMTLCQIDNPNVEIALVAKNLSAYEILICQEEDSAA